MYNCPREYSYVTLLLVNAPDSYHQIDFEAFFIGLFHLTIFSTTPFKTSYCKSYFYDSVFIFISHLFHNIKSITKSNYHRKIKEKVNAM